MLFSNCPDALDKPLTDQELAQQYEQQLATGVEERRALRARLRTVSLRLAMLPSMPCVLVGFATKGRIRKNAQSHFMRSQRR